MSEFLRVTPTSEELDPAGIPRLLESLHKLTSEDSGLDSTLNPLSSSTPPRFEFLALSDGEDAPVEFYYGADNSLDTVEERLQSIYPTTFDIERVDLDVEERLVQPAEYSREEFLNAYQQGNLQYEFDEDEQYAITDEGEAEAPDVDLTADRVVSIDNSALELAEDVGAPVEKPTMTDDGTILARPATETVSPYGVRWQGDATRKKDWMTSLTPFTDGEDEESLSAVDQPGAALASLIDHVNDAEEPLAFQVVFERRESWQSDAGLRKEDLRNGRDTWAQRIIGGLLEFGESERDERELSDIVERRLNAIEATNPQRSFTANIRAVGVPTSDDGQDSLDKRLSSLAPVFDPLDGPFYDVESERVRSSGFREAKKEKNARKALQRLLDRDIVTGRWKTRPDFVLSGRELAHFLLVPSSEQLSIEGSRGTRAEQQSRNPLPRPNPDLREQFREGMAIGYALDETGDPEDEPVRIPPDLLTTHYGRFASTGAGKSKAIINDALSLRETTGGPVVIVDRKGDGMCQNYLRSHHAQFDDAEDVYHFRVPETIPAFSFFDIRPALEAGRNREDAVQDKVDHFHDILRMILGQEKHERAFVANEILSQLIKALFDAEYGSDVFGLNDLFTAVRRMQDEQTIPPVSMANQPVEESLSRHLSKEESQFQTSMDAAGNRLEQLRESPHLRRVFNHTPAQNDAGEYVENHFDFRNFLDEDVTILLDLGDLRPEAQQAVTLLLLSNLWDAVQVRRRDGQTDYENLTNLIIEEAAPVASTRLVSEQLLPQGRSFGLSMGLVMQFPGQVRNRSERAYDEVLNNIKTKLIGNISMERDLAESLAHEGLSPTELRNRVNTLPSGEWIAQLPSPAFGETGPSPFSMKPLPIAEGHPESDTPLTEMEASQFESVTLPRIVERTQQQYGLSAESDTAADDGWGSGSDNSTSPEEETTHSESTMLSGSPNETSSDSTATESSPLLGGGDSTDNSEVSAPELASSESEADTSPVDAGGVSVPDAELERRGLSRDNARFLQDVLDVMNGADDAQSLLEPMSTLQDGRDELDIDRLVDQNLLSKTLVCRRTYFTVLPAGRELLGQKLAIGPGKGDIGERTPHKVGVELLRRWIQDRDDVTRVATYVEHDADTVFDVAGFDDDETLVWVGEAELPSHNRVAPIEDYEKMSRVDAEAVWAFNNRETALDILDQLADQDRINQRVTGRDARSFTKIRAVVDDLNAPGLTTLRSFNTLDEAYNE
ncbi:DNA helicase HerA-like ATPase [Halarchaeum rubridurum]|uniref:DNA helicase HerA-like ATPase n=2 Tax=Halarchaeum rubridurum TaxID=489911 RepID=A0A8T4GQL7_9EURY|nr:ATP-binding protein [Halarchaeum rubridurum]MBP1955866.1 DNA helicase HerA-like ATPase [Halarchaeum rubridurum]